MSNNSNGFEHAFFETAVAGGFFMAGAVVDEVLKAQSGGKPSNVGKAGAMTILGAMHLNGAREILDGWVKDA